jgi:hypothetical protein
MADHSLLRVEDDIGEQARRLVREYQGLDRWESELRRLQYGDPAELARLVGVSPASLAELGSVDLLAELIDTEVGVQLFGNDPVTRIHRLADVWYESQFRLPEVDETARLIAEFSRNPVTQWRELYRGTDPALASALETIRTPYLELNDALGSVSAVAELQSIGYGLDATAAFDPDFAPLLRGGLGDWRDAISWQDVALDPAPARIELYVEHGFDRDLTHLPTRAFKEVLGLSGLLLPVPATDEGYDSGESEPAYPDGIDVERNSQAYRKLLEFERYLRAFVDRVMTAMFGADWPQQRAPRDVYDEWTRRRKVAIQAGMAPSPKLIAYADFTDYEKIISRKDNWREVFVGFFNRPENARESLQRHYPVRHCTMHARAVTQEDELLMAVEIHRIVKATRPR